MKTVKQILSEVSKTDHLSKFDKRSPAGYPSEKNMPVVLIFKRKAIRTYPDNQKIGLYYSQALDKYISIPFGPGSQSAGIHISENVNDPRIVKPKRSTNDDEFEKRIARLPDQYKRAVRDMRKSGSEINTDDVVRKMSPREVADYNLPGGLRKKAVDTLTTSKLSGPRKAGRLAAIAYLGAGRMIGKGIKAVSKKLTAKKPVTNLETRTSSTMAKGIKEEALQEVVAGKLAKYAIKKFLRNRSKRQGRFADDEKGQATKKTNAWDSSKERGREATTPTGNHEFSPAGRARTAFGDAGARTTWDLSDPNQQTQRKFLDSLRTVKEEKTKDIKNNINLIREIVKNNDKSVVLKINENNLTLNNRVAKKVLTVYESLNKENRKKADAMLNEDVVAFRKFVNFAIKS